MTEHPQAVAIVSNWSGSHKLQETTLKPPGENVISMRMSELENWTKSES
jgi:hypothetical protein